MSIRFESLTDAYGWLDSHINYERALDRASYDGRTFELEAFSRLLESLDNPHRSTKHIHIAGTRGKGSTALFLEAILGAAGFKTAVYLSPHFREYRERIRIGGVPISGELFMRGLERAATASFGGSVASPPRHFKTVFEYLTALFFLVSRETQADWMIVETGLGGRLDATNALDPGPVILTRIGLEQTELLEPTIQAIAAEKAAILKPGGWGVADEQDASGGAMMVFDRRAAETGAPLLKAEERCPLLRANYDATGMDLIYVYEGTELSLRLSLYGTFIAENLQGVLALVGELIRRGELPPIERGVIRRALAGMTLSGRMEPVLRPRPGEPPLLIADCGHDPTAASGCAGTMRAHFPRAKGLAVVGMAWDKDHSGFFRELSRWPGWGGVVCYTLDHPRGTPAARLAEAAAPFFPYVEKREKIRQALEFAIEEHEKYNMVVATGSAYSVAAILDWGKGWGERHGYSDSASPRPPQDDPRPDSGNLGSQLPPL